MSTNKTTRLQSLDAFRGFTILAMILVNTPGSWSHLYSPLSHADWHGCTPTDLVFPFFLFIVGVSVWFSSSKFNYELNAAVFKKITKRAFLIFLIGLLLNAFPFFNLEIENLRIMGVLQRIALAFWLGATLCLLIKRYELLLLTSALILLIYWALLFYLGGEAPYSLESNFARAVDVKILGPTHLWQGKGMPFDPEGLFSTLPAIVSVIFGFLTGRMISSLGRKKLLSRMILLGVLGIGIGWIWGMFFPINKALWTSSYVLYTTGIALLFLALFIWLIDFKKYKSWAYLFLVFGMNSLFAYILSMVWVKILYTMNWTNGLGKSTNAYDWLYQEIMVPIAGNLNGSLLFAIVHILIFWAVLLVLYRKRIFIKV
ncbi:MAG: putative acyltransferase [Saprospiraceae bacterium]|jgi:predicted acyltransferase